MPRSDGAKAERVLTSPLVDNNNEEQSTCCFLPSLASAPVLRISAVTSYRHSSTRANYNRTVVHLVLWPRVVVIMFLCRILTLFPRSSLYIRIFAVISEMGIQDSCKWSNCSRLKVTLQLANSGGWCQFVQLPSTVHLSISLTREQDCRTYFATLTAGQ